MESRLMLCENGKVLSSEGWSVQPLGADFLEYSDGPDACLVNLGHSQSGRGRVIYASESNTEFFPLLREHLVAALPFLRGHWVLA
jgi:hypothetical protein